MTNIHSDTLNFCPDCGGAIEAGEVTHRAPGNEGSYNIFENVPALVCQGCGEYFLSCDVVETLQRLFEKSEPVKQVVTSFFNYERALA